MFSELLEIAWDFIKKIITSRLFALAVLFTVMFTGLIGTLFRMQILEGNQYQDEYMQMTEQTVTTPGIRGNIYDRNGYPLAYNELAYSVTIQDLGDYPRPEDRNAMIYRLVTILNRRGETVEGKFEIAMDADGEMAFTCSSDSAKTRFLLNFYGLSSSDQLDDARGRYPSDVTAYEAFEYKKKEYELDQMKDEKGNALILPDATALDMINIIYTMNLTRYQKYVKTTVASNISEETMMEINENIADLKGVAVEQAYIRRYADSVYFAPIIGYTGKVQEDQLDALNEEWRATADGQSAPADTVKYDLNDVVGRSGIEQSMELELQGDKGFSRMYVDNMGRPREIIENEDAQAGNDVYLTIDRDLQVAIYHLIEQQLAGILVKNLVNEDVDKTQITDSSKVPIPVKDAYYQLINNNVLSLDHMAGGEAAPIEQEIYSIYLSAREQILGAVDWSLPWAGILFCWAQTGFGMALCLTVPALLAAGSVGALAALRPNGRLPRGKEEEPPAQAADPFPDLDYRFGAKSPAAPANVKTVVITQTRPASSAIRNQKGEVRIYASGQESVLPLSVGRRVVSLGGYQITVDIARTGSRTEDITRELPAMRRRAGGQAAEPDTREITIIRPQQKPSDSAPETGKPDENKDDN